MSPTDMSPNAEDGLLRELDEAKPVRRRRRRRRRRPAPKANWFWRFLFPLVVVGLGYATFELWREGTKAVLDSTDGTLIEVVSDPNAPGFEAFVSSTPTMIVLHTDDTDRLVGVTVLARTLLDNGGQGVLLSADLAADGLGGATLADRYAAEGASAVERDVGTLFGFGFSETLTLATADFGPLLALVEPLQFALLDDLVNVTGDGTAEIWLEAGGKQLDGETAAEVYAFRNPDEPDVNRNERQLDLWESWLLSISQADDLDAAALPFDEGLSAYLKAFAVGQRDLQLAPARPANPNEAQPVYVFDDAGRAWLADVAERMTPLPIAPIGSDLPSVRLLDGTGDRRIAQEALDVVVRLSEVEIFGNATEFGLSQTTVSYHDPAGADAAADLASSLGGLAQFDPRPDDPVDLTVVIGTDWEAP